MITKIICPTDCSSVANNAIEYAAKLAQIFNVELQLLNIQDLATVELARTGEYLSDDIMSTPEVLNNTCGEINKIFSIPCSYVTETNTDSLQEAITKKAGGSNLIVIGTNGVDDLHQYFFGTNTFNVIKKANCPVLLVPENAKYAKVKKIIFAWDYNSQNKLSLSQLGEFISVFHPKTVLLHISKQKTEIGQDVFRALKNEILSHLKKQTDIEFERVYSDDISSSINDYMNKSKSDMLAITFYDRGIIRNLFHNVVMKKLSETAEFPILVLHV